MKYGRHPAVVGKFETECPEFMHVVYLPVHIPGVGTAIPDNLEWTRELILEAMLDCETLYRKDELDELHVYITAKHNFVTKGQYPNRPNWHSDGFLTDDVNYVWYDSVPTEFCAQPFDLTEDHAISMREMQEQASVENIVTYPANTLLRLDSSVIHRVAAAQEDGIRTFVKVSVSKEQYRLKGNAHNYLLNYEWEMQDRQFNRNCPLGRK